MASIAEKSRPSGHMPPKKKRPMLFKTAKELFIGAPVVREYTDRKDRLVKTLQAVKEIEIWGERFICTLFKAVTGYLDYREVGYIVKIERKGRKSVHWAYGRSQKRAWGSTTRVIESILVKENIKVHSGLSHTE